MIVKQMAVMVEARTGTNFDFVAATIGSYPMIGILDSIWVRVDVAHQHWL